MKKIALATVFAVAALPMMFAAQATPQTPTKGTAAGQTESTTKKTTKKHGKKSKKSETTKAPAASK